MKRIYLLLLAVLSGLLLALSWPERGINLLAFVAFVPLFFVQQQLGDTRKHGMFWLAWLAFFIWNALTTWWIWHSTDIGSILAMSWILFQKIANFVIFYGLIELVSGISNRPGDNVAHFAHLGGMVFGFILIMYWKKKGKLFE